jgi:hypothetical protein
MFCVIIAITGHTLTRAIFDTLDVDNSNSLTAFEIDNGLRELMKEDEHLDCVTVAVAKKVAREMSPYESISMRDFEERAMAASQGLTDPSTDKSSWNFEQEHSFLMEEQFP